jgi:hypothetical protein
VMAPDQGLAVAPQVGVSQSCLRRRWLLKRPSSQPSPPPTITQMTVQSSVIIRSRYKYIPFGRIGERLIFFLPHPLGPPLLQRRGEEKERGAVAPLRRLLPFVRGELERDFTPTPYLLTSHSSITFAASLSRGLLLLPHLGDCTQEGQPSWQGHSAITFRVASQSSSIIS